MPVTDVSAYCEACGHAHRPGTRCKVRDGFGERCGCTGRDDDASDFDGESQ